MSTRNPLCITKHLHQPHPGLWLSVGLAVAGLLLLTTVVRAGTNISVPGPAGSGSFGTTVLVLPNGNILVTDATYSIPDGATNVGAAYLYDGRTHQMISMLTGSTTDDGVGTNISALPNGNFLVLSPYWANGAASKAGAVTWGNGVTGVTGTVSAANSLVGSTSNDCVGSLGVTGCLDGRLEVFDNSNYLVRTPSWHYSDLISNAGAVTLGNGATGITGVVTATNSLVGSYISDYVGHATNTISNVLSNGTYILRDPLWHGNNYGSITCINLTTGITGVVGAANSLVGSHANDKLGQNALVEFGAGNYYAVTTAWYSSAGAITRFDPNTCPIGIVDATNSLVGSRPSDGVGANIQALSNGKYVVRSPNWDYAPTVANAGAVTWFDPAIGITGAITATNSLVGGRGSDQVGSTAVVEVKNGNYVIASPKWANGAKTLAGAVTWVRGSTGITGPVTISNSLVGSNISDSVGIGGVYVLANGNYVVDTPNWTSGVITNAGAATWGDGDVGISGVVSITNSLVGSQTADQVGFSGIITLTNGDYVVRSERFKNGDAAGAGAVTWANGTTGITGVVTTTNSLVGATANDNVGQKGVALANGNYVIGAPNWDNGAIANAGAVTWVMGDGAFTGTVTTANSLVGGSANIMTGADGLEALTNGNYIVRSSSWGDGSKIDAGAITWGNGETGITGTISVTNSLVGGASYDFVGSAGFSAATSNGNYLIRTDAWQNGAAANVGAVTWINGSTGITGVLSAANSLVGSTGSDAIGDGGLTLLSDGSYLVRSSHWDNGGATDAGAVTRIDPAVGVKGVVGPDNSLVGSTASDLVGATSMTLTMLNNGNYLLLNRLWDNGAATNAGAVTWFSPTLGIKGTVGPDNSLVGSHTSDGVGSSGAITLSNGMYLIYAPLWDNGAASNAGSITWFDPAAGVRGAIGPDNSLVGSTANDKIGNYGITELANGKYIVRSINWTNGSVGNAGAVTWFDPAVGIIGPVTTTNSLVGTSRTDFIGYFATALSSGNYLVQSPYWDNGALTDAGAITWGEGATGTRGVVSSNSSLVGETASGGPSMVGDYSPGYEQIVAGRPHDNVMLFYDMRQVTMTKQVAAATTPVGFAQPITYTLTLSGASPYSDTAVIFTDTLPTGASFDRWIQRAGAQKSGDVISWTGGVDAGSAVTVSFVATNTAPPVSTVKNTVYFSGTTRTGSAVATYDSSCYALVSGFWTVVFALCPPDAKHQIPPGISVTLDQDIGLSGDLEVDTGGALLANNYTMSLTGSMTQTLIGDLLTFDNLIVDKTARTPKIPVTVDGRLKVTQKLTVRSGKLVSASDYEDIEIGLDGELQLTNDITISGNFTNTGDVDTNGFGVTFDGARAQNLALDNVTVFDALTVYTGTTLIETDSGDHAAVSALTNYGVIRKTQPIALTTPDSYYFGLAGSYPGSYGMQIDVTDQGGGAPLTALQVDRIDKNHPNAPGGATTDVYWAIKPTGSDFVATLTLPQPGLANPGVCRYHGAIWNCARTSFDSTTDMTATLEGVTAFSDWAVFQTETTTTTLTASANSAEAGQVITFTASVEPAGATGSVEYFADGASLGSVEVSGSTAHLTTTALSIGTHIITATLNTTGAYLPGAAALSPNQEITCAGRPTVANTSDQGAYSLRWAVGAACPGGTVDFAPAILGQTITLTSGEITVDKHLTIDGPGAALLALSGNRASRIFTVTTGSDVTINGLTLRDGASLNEPGGAIYSAGPLTVTSSSFITNVAHTTGATVNADGGAIALIGSSSERLVIVGTAFVSNTALSEGNMAIANGGAIAVNDGDLMMATSTFTNNMALGAIASYGGAIACQNCGFSIADSAIATSWASGGAFYINDVAVTHQGAITNTIFHDNAAEYMGSALFASNYDAITLSNTQFLSNTVINGNGGAINIVAAAKLTVDGGAISYNQASNGNGGGIYLDNQDAECSIMLALNQVRLEHNLAMAGGAIYSNKASGGACGRIEDTDFVANSASSRGGGAVALSDDQIDIVHSRFEANSCAVEGGAISANGANSLAITNTTFLSNTANDGGGAIYFSKNVTVTGSRLEGNQATGSGGAIQCEWSTLTISRSVFTRNNATNAHGGAIACDWGSLLTVNDSAFTGNTALAGGANGGAISNGDEAESTVIVDGSTFEANQAFQGGAVESYRHLNVSNSTFYNNAATDATGGGGAVLVTGRDVYITNTTIYSNSAPGNGGGIRIKAGAGTTFVLANNLVGDNTGGSCSTGGASISGIANLATDDTCGGAFTQVSDALVAAPGEYGGATQTAPLLPGSPAINAGDAGACLATDQRGVTRPQGSGCDVGAFESQGFTLTKGGGDNQKTGIGQPFADSVTMTVESNAWQGKTEPVDGGKVTIAGPLSGAGVTPITTTATIATNAASADLNANSEVGAYEVHATALGASAPITYNLHNMAATTTTVSSEPQPAIYGQAVTFTTTVTATSGSPTGSVTVTLDNEETVLPLVNAMATFTRSNLAAGEYPMVATYSGNANFAGSVSAVYTQTVQRVGTAITLTATPNPATTQDTITFTATVTISGAVAGTPTGWVTFTVGSTVLTGTLGGDGIATATAANLPVGNHSVSADYTGDRNFAPWTIGGNTQVIQAILVLGKAGAGEVASEPVGTRFDYGTMVTITATPLISSTFTEWSGDVSGATSPVTVTMTDNKAVTATFVIKTFEITPTAGVNGAITPSTAQTVNYGSDKAFTIAADPHYHILDVAADGVSVGAVDVYTFTNVTANHILTASFAIDVHSLSLFKDGTGDGTVANEPAGSSFDYGTVVTVTATPYISSTFTEWSGDASGATSPVTVTITGDKAITATFAIKTFEITPTAGAHGGITPSTAQTLNYGVVQAFTIAADPHYHILDVAADGVSVGAVDVYTFTNVTADHILTATFAIDTYNLSLFKAGTGDGTLANNPAGSNFDYGTVVTVTATPYISSTFTGWSGDASGVTNPVTVTISGDKAVTATYAIKTFEITPTAEANGSITPSTPQTLIYGNKKGFTIAADPHYHILDVAADGVSVGAVDVYTFTNVTADHVLTASFAIDVHSLNLYGAGAGDGTVVKEPAGSSFNYGMVVTLTATPLISSTFTDWSGDAVGATNPVTVTITGDKAVTATFTIKHFPLDLYKAGTGDGAVVHEPAGSNFDYGAVVTVTATPYISSTFTGWSGDAGGVTNPLLVTMDVTRAITATYTMKTYVITPTAGANGGITPDNPQTVNYGADQAFTIAADPHYHILDVAVDGVSVGAVDVYTFTNVTADHILTAIFAINVHSLALFKDGTGDGTVANEPAGSSFDYGTVVTLTATPHISSTFTEWSGDAGGTDKPIVVTIDGDKAVTATFTLKTYVITPTTGANGGITPSIPQTANYAGSQRFDIAPNAHYHIVDVAVDGVSVGAIGAYTFTNVTADHTISATFAIDTHTLMVVKTGAGVGAIGQAPAGTVFDYGTVVTLTATPVLTSTFTGWSGAATGKTNPLPVTIDGDKAITGTFIIRQLPTTTTLQSGLNPALVLDNIVFTAQVAENLGAPGVRFVAAGPTGQVVISDPTGAISVTGTLVNGGVQLSTSSLDAGSYNVTAVYRGDTYHAPSVSDLVVQVVNKRSTTTQLTVAPNPVYVGDQIYFTATVEWDELPGMTREAMQAAGIGGPTGDVDFLADGLSIDTAPLVNGVASIHGIAPVTGTFHITAHYLGDRASATSVSNDVTLRIKRRPTTVTLTSAPNPSKGGETVAFTATVEEAPAALSESDINEELVTAANRAAIDWNIGVTAAPIPTGEVRFIENGVTLGAGNLVNGVASFADHQLPVGSHTISARFMGDTMFTSSNSAPVEQVVQPLPTAVNDAAGFVQGEAKKINVLANDLNPAGGLHVTAVTQPAHGLAQVGPQGKYVYFTAATNAGGMENFTYTATDVNGNSSAALVSVLVNHPAVGQGGPQVKPVTPGLGANLAFTSTGANVDAKLSPGFYTRTLQPEDIFFLAFTPYITPTGNTATPPTGFKFGNYEFELTPYVNGATLSGVIFAIPITLTIDYDPALVGDLNPATLGLWHWTGSAWSTDGVKIVRRDVAAHKLTIAISHMSEFALFAAEVPSVTVYMPELNTGALQEAIPAPEVVQPQVQVTPVLPVLPSPFEMFRQIFMPAMGK